MGQPDQHMTSSQPKGGACPRVSRSAPTQPAAQKVQASANLGFTKCLHQVSIPVVLLCPQGHHCHTRVYFPSVTRGHLGTSQARRACESPRLRRGLWGLAQGDDLRSQLVILAAASCLPSLLFVPSSRASLLRSVAMAWTHQVLLLESSLRCSSCACFIGQMDEPGTEGNKISLNHMAA